jgi:hypothetical protein
MSNICNTVPVTQWNPYILKTSNILNNDFGRHLLKFCTKVTPLTLIQLVLSFPGTHSQGLFNNHPDLSIPVSQKSCSCFRCRVSTEGLLKRNYSCWKRMVVTTGQVKRYTGTEKKCDIWMIMYVTLTYIHLSQHTWTMYKENKNMHEKVWYDNWKEKITCNI